MNYSCLENWLNVTLSDFEPDNGSAIFLYKMYLMTHTSASQHIFYCSESGNIGLKDLNSEQTVCGKSESFEPANISNNKKKQTVL